MITPGQRLDNKYDVIRRLGGGGFGDVFLASDAEIPGREVAIKVLSHPEPQDQSDLIWEMRALSSVCHPHVVAFHHHFRDDERLYLVMEYCPGGSLHDRFNENEGLPEDLVMGWGSQLCDALAHVHQKGIVHHDIKPMNVLFTADGVIKLSDFGVANRNIGTLIYMPPEMLLGEAVSRRDPRIDIYALGLTLLEAMTGVQPFLHLHKHGALQARVVHNFVPAHLGQWVQEIILKATHPMPEMRFQNASDFADAIRGKHVPYLLDGKQIKADALARKSENAISRKKWKNAEKLASHALGLSPDCIPALLAAGRCELLLRRIDRAHDFFTRALEISPRAPVQKELGWISLEQGRIPTAISLLTDHLQRHSSDYEAYNLLLKCYYLTDRYEAAETLAESLIDAKAPAECFLNNRLICRLLRASASDGQRKLSTREAANPFFFYNHTVATERPAAFGPGERPSLKSKLLFEEYQYSAVRRSGSSNTVAIYMSNGSRLLKSSSVVTIGAMPSNDVVLKDRSVSRRHCVIVNFSNEVWLYDLGSVAGTTVDGESLDGRRFLDGVHEVRIGQVTLRIAASSDILI